MRYRKYVRQDPTCEGGNVMTNKQIQSVAKIATQESQWRAARLRWWAKQYKEDGTQIRHIIKKFLWENEKEPEEKVGQAKRDFAGDKKIIAALNKRYAEFRAVWLDPLTTTKQKIQICEEELGIVSLKKIIRLPDKTLAELSIPKWRRNDPEAMIKPTDMQAQQQPKWEEILKGKASKLWKCYANLTKERFEDKEIEDAEKAICKHCKNTFRGQTGLVKHWTRQKSKMDEEEESGMPHDRDDYCIEAIAADGDVCSDGEEGMGEDKRCPWKAENEHSYCGYPGA